MDSLYINSPVEYLLFCMGTPVFTYKIFCAYLEKIPDLINSGANEIDVEQ